jgi:antitoxin component of MazEF toxin-antitoxin module
MPIIRKLTTVGDSKGITLPKSWLESAEADAGRKIVALALEIDKIITVSPVFEKEKEASAI